MFIIKNKLFPYLFFCAVLAMTSCTKKLNTNLTDPNGVGINSVNGSEVFAQALLSTVQNKIGSNISTASDNYDHATQWMGYLARNTGWASSGSQLQMETFTLNNSYSNGIWQSLYHNIYDYNFVMANSLPNSVLPGASKVMRSMVFQDLVDQFANVPYSQAAQPSVSLTPKYDSAQAIYTGLIKDLDSAILSLSASQSTADDASDIMFKGNKTLWTAFANTIKLRILIRQVPNGNQSYVASEIQNIVTQGGGFLGAGQDASINPGFADAVTQQNPFWGDYGFQPNGGSPYQNNSFFCGNNFMINFLNSTSDPRLGYFYGLNSASGYAGENFGETLNPTTSPIGPGILQSPKMPGLLFSASQSLFMQAEAAQRGLITGNYASLFKQGVEESFRYLTVPNYATAADNFMSTSANGLVNIAVSTNPLQTILYQKWVAECELDGYEAWSDYRRTGFPYIATPSYSAIGQPIPTRLLYPESEYTQNATNVNAQNQQSSDIYKPIFWGL